MRSLLFVPGGRVEMLAKVGRVTPDTVVVDLEDAVPAAGKDAAREAVAAALRAGRPEFGGLLLVRINAVDTEEHAADVATCAELIDAGMLDGVVLPKYERVAELTDLQAALPVGAAVMVGVESALGVADARPLLAAGPHAVYFGSDDFIADLGGRRTAAGNEVLYARSAVLLAANLAGVPAVDQAVVAVRDEDTFRCDANVGRNLGYGGKICLHPTQVVIAHEVFTPGPAEVDHARAVLAAAVNGVGELNGMMVDAVHVRMARDILIRAGQPVEA
ncbi:MAG TPA: CoA ester lyase [Sporichthyaceae bacterium]|nr:CoA ester lyase [Sporichthyaceae bacterium]